MLWPTVELSGMVATIILTTNDMKKKKIYISGAISHHDLDERKTAFEITAAFCEACGFESVNPFDNGLPQPGDWREHMRVDIKMLLDCDAICMMDGWEASKGCKLEHDVASTCGLTVYYESDIRVLGV